MKANRLLWAFLLLSLGAVAFQLPAQQADSDREFFEKIKIKAEQGDAQAQFRLGICYELGRGVPKDEAEAVKWCRKAADQGHAPAQCSLGWHYNFGRGLPQDYAEAVKWVRKAADQGYGRAQWSLGLSYTLGHGVPKDEAEAVKWYRKAADQGNADGQYSLGVCYNLGEGVPKDYAEAVKWFRKAADQGLADAQWDLGNSYALGDGVPKDDAEAVKWYRRAANQGHARAQWRLGNHYAKGEGIPQNDLEAYVWLSLAAVRGNKIAALNCKMVAQGMSREDVVEGQRRAAAFVAKEERRDPAGESKTWTMTSLVGDQPKAYGTGFFITDDGYLLSNFHVVAKGLRVMVRTKTGELSATVVKTDPANELALLKVSGASRGLPLVSSRTVKMGSTVAIVGFPTVGLQGFAPKLAKGEIAALTGALADPRYFQISVLVQPGNSGGALLDERGNVVGMVTAKLSAKTALVTSGTLPENVNYAIKSSFLLGSLESVPEVSAKLNEPNTKERRFEDVVTSAEEAAVLVLVY